MKGHEVSDRGDEVGSGLPNLASEDIGSVQNQRPVAAKLYSNQ